MRENAVPLRKAHLLASGEHPFRMTAEEKKRLSAVLRATEYLFLENIALKLVLEHRQVPHWQKLLDRLLADKEMLAGVRLKFRDIHAAVEGTADPSEVLEDFLANCRGQRRRIEVALPPTKFLTTGDTGDHGGVHRRKCPPQ